MTGPAPQSTAKEINEGANALLRESDAFRTLADPRVLYLWDEATKLQKADARASFSLRGTLSAICGDIPGTQEFYRKALLHPNVDATRMEYWTALGNLGLYSAASEQGSWLLDPRRHFFPTIWERAASGGHLLELWDRLPGAIQLFPDLAKLDFKWLENGVAVMKESGATDKQIFSVFDVMGEVQRAHGLMFAGPLISYLKVMIPPDDPPYLHFAMRTDATFEKLHEMNRALAKTVVRKLPNGMFPPGVVGTFEKAVRAETKAAA